jgi:hypothetical protein
VQAVAAESGYTTSAVGLSRIHHPIELCSLLWPALCCVTFFKGHTAADIRAATVLSQNLVSKELSSSAEPKDALMGMRRRESIQLGSRGRTAAQREVRTG